MESEGRQIKQCCTYLGVRIEVVLVPEKVLLVLRHLLGDEHGEAGHLPQAARPHVPAQPGQGIINFMYRSCGAFLYAPYSFLLIYNKFWMEGGWGAVRLCYLTALEGWYGPESSLRYPWSPVHKTNYAPMIYTALCAILFMRAASISWASVRGLGIGRIFSLDGRTLNKISIASALRLSTSKAIGN